MQKSVLEQTTTERKGGVNAAVDDSKNKSEMQKYPHPVNGATQMGKSGDVDKTSHEYIRLKRERTRNRVVHFLLGILLLTIIGIFVLIWNGKESSTFIQTVLPLLTTLIGSALGFYFGGQEREHAVTERSEKIHDTEPGD